jgi:hypothetical protein
MRRKVFIRIKTLARGFLLALAISMPAVSQAQSQRADDTASASRHDATAENAVDLVGQGRQIFRFDTFGDEQFWGDMLSRSAQRRATLRGLCQFPAAKRLPPDSRPRDAERVVPEFQSQSLR